MQVLIYSEHLVEDVKIRMVDAGKCELKISEHLWNHSCSTGARCNRVSDFRLCYGIKDVAQVCQLHLVKNHFEYWSHNIKVKLVMCSYTTINVLKK